MSGWLGKGVPRICVIHLNSWAFMACTTLTCRAEALHTNCSCVTFESCSRDTVQGHVEIGERA